MQTCVIRLQQPGWAVNKANIGFPYIFINQDNKRFLPVNFKINDINALIGLDDIVLGDFNGDGETDILGINGDNNSVRITLALAQKQIDWSAVKDSFQGEYSAQWFLGDVNQNNKLEYEGNDSFNLVKGSGHFDDKGTYQPSANLRKLLNISYRPDGEIKITGNLDLFDRGRSYPTTFSGNIKAGQASAIWQEGDLVVIKFKKNK